MKPKPTSRKKPAATASAKRRSSKTPGPASSPPAPSVRSVVDFNINGYMLVKLTDRGRAIHKHRHEELMEGLGKGFNYRPPEEDAEGWSKWQAWSLFQTFGPYMSLGMDPPFETDIRIVLPGHAPSAIVPPAFWVIDTCMEGQSEDTSEARGPFTSQQEAEENIKRLSSGDWLTCCGCLREGDPQEWGSVHLIVQEVRRVRPVPPTHVVMTLRDEPNGKDLP